jgi:alpha-L-rhamnosidase
MPLFRCEFTLKKRPVSATLRALRRAGRSNIVLATLERKDPPSYGSQIAVGATSLTESWSGQARSSQDHFMLGAAEEWFYRAPDGIDFDMSRSVDERITIQPVLVPQITLIRHAE